MVLGSPQSIHGNPQICQHWKSKDEWWIGFLNDSWQTSRIRDDRIFLAIGDQIQLTWGSENLSSLSQSGGTWCDKNLRWIYNQLCIQSVMYAIKSKWRKLPLLFVFWNAAAWQSITWLDLSIKSILKSNNIHLDEIKNIRSDTGLRWTTVGKLPSCGTPFNRIPTQMRTQWGTRAKTS